MSPTARVMKSPKPPSRTNVRITRATRSQTSRSAINSVIASASSSSVDPVVATVRRTNARRGRPPRAIDTAPLVEEDREDNSIQINTPATPQSEQTNVQVVDLITPQPPTPISRAARRPVEVDLTCDLDDEVFVVLEDIVNPSRTNPSVQLPVQLGTSPSRVRVAPRNLRPYFVRRIESPTPELETCQTVEAEIAPKASTSVNEYASSNGIHCPICLDSLAQVKEANHQMHSTICGHVFCGPCITKVLASTQQCPTCRKRLDLRKIHPIFI